VRSLHTRQYRTYIAELVCARTRAKLTQEVLARRLKKPQSFVSKYERGERRLDVPEFLAISRALGCTSTALLRRIETAIYGAAERARTSS
jgi:transcriptional regulator with XRE-family HTH domain